MIPRDIAQRIGIITRRWGYEGEINLRLDEEFIHLKKLPESVFVEIQGRLIPFLVFSHRKQSANTFIAHLADSAEPVLSRLLQAEVWCRTEDLKEKKAAVTSGLSPVGFEVHDKNHGFTGLVKEIWDRDEQPLLVVMHNNIEILIPFAAEIIRKTDHKKRRIHIDAPEGLIDMYLNP